MNLTLPFNDSDYESFMNVVVPVVVYVGTLILFITFPIYVFVHRMNKGQDGKTAVFQIINHFYGMMIKLYVVVILLLVLHVLFRFRFKKEKHFFIEFVILISCVPALYVFAQVNQLMLSLLAVQRFLLYFYPSTEKYLNLSGRSVSWIAYSAYLLFAIDAFATIYWFYFPNEIIETIIESLALFLNLLVFFSALLYIPIVISIRKLLHLTSAQLNQPHRYVAWQLVVISIGKTLSALAFITIIYDDSLMAALIQLKTMDAFLSPFVIQITYIGCNRRNLQTFLSSLTWKKMWKMFLCPCLLSAEVGIAHAVNMDTTHAAQN